MGGKRLGAAMALAAMAGACGPEADAGSNGAAPAAAELAADANAADSGALTSDVGKRVVKLVVNGLGVDPGRVTMSARLIDDLGADSLDIVELVMASEEEFGVEIPDSAAERMVTVGDMVDYIEDAVPSQLPRLSSG